MNFKLIALFFAVGVWAQQSMELAEELDPNLPELGGSTNFLLGGTAAFILRFVCEFIVELRRRPKGGDDPVPIQLASLLRFRLRPVDAKG